MILKKKLYQVNDFFIICESADEAIATFKDEIGQEVASLVCLSNEVIIPDCSDQDSVSTYEWVTDRTDQVNIV